MASENTKTVLVAGTANFVIAGAKLGGGLVSGSSALLAEAAHSIADTMNEVFLYVSLQLGERPPDEEHPFGFGKERFFWAFLAAVFIFVGGAGFSIYEGISALVAPSGQAPGFGIAFAVLGVSLLAEGTSLLRAYRQTKGEARQARQGIRTYLRHSKDPTVKTVLFEDTAAVTGVLVAMVGLGLSLVTGNHAWDAVASIVIGLLLAYAAYGLGRDVKGLLLGEAASPQIRRQLREVIAGHEEVDDVLDLLTMHLGPESILVAVRFDPRDGLSSSDVEELSSQIDRELREAVPAVREVFLDATPRREGSTAPQGAERDPAPKQAAP